MLKKFCQIQYLGNTKAYIEKKSGDYQNGFRDGRFVIDNIFVLKIINEKIWEYKKNSRFYRGNFP